MTTSIYWPYQPEKIPQLPFGELVELICTKPTCRRAVSARRRKLLAEWRWHQSRDACRDLNVDDTVQVYRRELSLIEHDEKLDDESFWGDRRNVWTLEEIVAERTRFPNTAEAEKEIDAREEVIYD